jgi:hypothetical protein
LPCHAHQAALQLGPGLQEATELPSLDLGADLGADAIAEGLYAVGVRVERGTGNRLEVLAPEGIAAGDTELGDEPALEVQLILAVVIRRDLISTGEVALLEVGPQGIGRADAEQADVRALCRVRSRKQPKGFKQRVASGFPGHLC